jgi:hypothetical protein
VQARLYPKTGQRLTLLGRFIFLVVTTLALNGCGSLTFRSKRAEALPVPEATGLVCLKGSGSESNNCKPNSIEIEELSEPGAPIIYRLVSKDDAQIFMTTLEHCGRNYSAETMLRQLFADSQSVRITQIKEFQINNQELTKSSANIRVDEQNISLEVYSQAEKCFQDWIFWKIDPQNNGFSSRETKKIEQVFGAVWSSN